MIIHGSDINLDALVGVKSLADLKKLNIFSHLPNKDEANEKLWKIIGAFKEIEEPEPILTEGIPDDGND
jgi:hypothetical protein